MIRIKTDTEIKEYLDELTHEFIIEQMKKDCPEFAKSVNSKPNEWIWRIILMTGSTHEGSVIPFGYLLRYQFRKIAIGYDMGIREIVIAENTDEFLDLINDVKRNPEMFNLTYVGK
jgi:hypothetical protein